MSSGYSNSGLLAFVFTDSTSIHPVSSSASGPQHLSRSQEKEKCNDGEEIITAKEQTRE